MDFIIGRFKPECISKMDCSPKMLAIHWRPDESPGSSSSPGTLFFSLKSRFCRPGLLYSTCTRNAADCGGMLSVSALEWVTRTIWPGRRSPKRIGAPKRLVNTVALEMLNRV